MPNSWRPRNEHRQARNREHANRGTTVHGRSQVVLGKPQSSATEVRYTRPIFTSIKKLLSVAAHCKSNPRPVPGEAKTIEFENVTLAPVGCWVRVSMQYSGTLLLVGLFAGSLWQCDCTLDAERGGRRIDMAQTDSAANQFGAQEAHNPRAAYFRCL